MKFAIEKGEMDRRGESGLLGKHGNEGIKGGREGCESRQAGEDNQE